MKIQPIDADHQTERAKLVKPSVLKSRLKWLFNCQFPSVLKISTVDKPAACEQLSFPAPKDAKFEPTSMCLANMVQSYMEETNDKPFKSCHCCNCFNPNGNDSFDNEFDSFSSPDPPAGNGNALDFLKVFTGPPHDVSKPKDAPTIKLVDSQQIQVPIGPMTRARDRKLQSDFNGLMQEVWAQASAWRIKDVQEAQGRLMHVSEAKLEG